MSVWQRWGICALAVLCFPLAGQARCTIEGPVGSTHDQNIAPIRFGRVNLASSYLQPAGTLLATAVVPPTHFIQDSAHADKVMWECDQADVAAGEVYFLVATNGDDRIGGYHETGQADGLPGVYATAFAYVGIKLTMAGEVVRRRWTKIPLEEYETTGSKVRIRLKDIPVMQAELYRISQLPDLLGAPSDFCASRIYGLAKPTPEGKAYPWCGGRPQPSAYIQLVGPQISHDEAGEDSAKHYAFWGGSNGFGYGMWNSGTTFSNLAACVVRNHDTHVHFPTVSAQQLMNGSTVVQPFSVQIECDDNAVSGAGVGQVALGFQVSRGAYAAAKKLGLVNGQEGVRYLLADDYDMSTTAQGVGVSLQNPAMASGDLWWIGEPSLLADADMRRGNQAGWYPAQAGAEPSTGGENGYRYWQHTFTATLGRIGALPVKPGNFKATATILVKVQ